MYYLFGIMFQSRVFASEKKECRFFSFFFAVLILEIIAEFFFVHTLGHYAAVYYSWIMSFCLYAFLTLSPVTYPLVDVL